MSNGIFSVHVPAAPETHTRQKNATRNAVVSPFFGHFLLFIFLFFFSN